MKILVNASTCVVGGGAQVAANFIALALFDRRHQFFFVISPEVFRQLRALVELESAAVRERLIEASFPPSRGVAGLRTRRLVAHCVHRFAADVVFTVFGPSYQKFSVPHVCGYARPYDTHASPIALKLLPWNTRVKYTWATRYRLRGLSRKDFYWTETATAREGLAQKTGIPTDHIRVIPNAFSPIFEPPPSRRVERDGSRGVVLTVGAPYVHKRFSLIPQVAEALKNAGFAEHVSFRVTLPHEHRETARFLGQAKNYGVSEMITNLGRLTLGELRDEYLNADCVFLPTVLETFSVSYLEAMQMGVPIITSDLDFARDICGDAAEFFPPESAKDAGAAITRVLANPQRWEELSFAGEKRVAEFPSITEKYEAHIEWLEEVVKRCSQ